VTMGVSKLYFAKIGSYAKVLAHALNGCLAYFCFKDSHSPLVSILTVDGEIGKLPKCSPFFSKIVL